MVGDCYHHFHFTIRKLIREVKILHWYGFQFRYEIPNSLKVMRQIYYVVSEKTQDSVYNVIPNVYTHKYFYLCFTAYLHIDIRNLKKGLSSQMETVPAFQEFVLRGGYE